MKTSRYLRLFGLMLALASGVALTTARADDCSQGTSSSAQSQTIPSAVTSAAKRMAEHSKSKLDGITPKAGENGATVYVVSLTNSKGKTHKIVLDDKGHHVGGKHKGKKDKKDKKDKKSESSDSQS